AHLKNLVGAVARSGSDLHLLLGAHHTLESLPHVTNVRIPPLTSVDARLLVHGSLAQEDEEKLVRVLFDNRPVTADLVLAAADRLRSGLGWSDIAEWLRTGSSDERWNRLI